MRNLCRHIGFRSGPAIAVLGLALVIFLIGAASRSREYDEQYTLFLTGGIVRPDFPPGITSPQSLHRHWQRDASPVTTAMIAQGLRSADVHPPLYFWLAAAWRRGLGVSVPGLGLFRMRLFSALTALISLLVLAAIAWLCDAPPALAMLFTLGCYGFTYTAITARNFALADMLLLCGVLAALGSDADDLPIWRGDGGMHRTPLALLSGLLLGAACYTNYLTAFATVTVILWLIIRRLQAGLIAGLGAAAFLPAGCWFFLAQRNARPGQFPRFEMLHALVLLSRDGLAALFGGLPAYAPEGWHGIASALLLLGLSGIAISLIYRHGGQAWNRRLGLVLLCLLAQGLGLPALGLAFGTTPIEIRYLAFTCPFFSILLAWRLRACDYPRIPTASLLAIQAGAIAGLLLMAPTMQPIEAALGAVRSLAKPGSLLLVPFGNDGVGVAGAIANGAPAQMPMMIFHRRMPSPETIAALTGFHSLMLLDMRTDQQSIAQSAAMQAWLGSQGWQPVQRGFDVIAYARLPKNAGSPQHRRAGKDP